MQQTVTLPLIDDDMTINDVIERLRSMKRGGFVLGDPKGSRVVTVSALRRIQKDGPFDADTKIGDLRKHIFPTWTELPGFWDRVVRGRVNVGGVSVPRSLADRPPEAYSILETDRKNRVATVLVSDPFQLDELEMPPPPA